MFLIAMLFLVLGSLSFVSADYQASANHVYINRTVITQINISISAPPNVTIGNITLVNITLPTGFTFIAKSNITTLTAGEYQFWNISNRIWWNMTNSTFKNDTTHNFIFNVTASIHGNYNIAVNATRVDGTGNSSGIPIVVNFAFAGYIKNETGGIINGTNVSIYRFTTSQTGPPTETLDTQITVTDNNTGIFNFGSLNGSVSMYLLKFIHYNATNSATKTGTVLPAFPAQMYYSISSSVDISFNGSTFYLQPAATLRLNATNSSGAFVPFGYEVIDQKIGFPIASNIKGNESTWKDIVVPTGRSYSVMILRELSQFMTVGNFGQQCDGKHLSAMNCSAPPKSNSSFGTLTAGGVTLITTNLTVTSQGIYGCINISTGASPNKDIINITSIVLRIVPFSTSSGAFIPPMRAEERPINTTLAVNYTTSQTNKINNSLNMSCVGHRAFYNFSIMGGGFDYVIEFYGKNASYIAGIGEADSGGVYLAGFQNVTINAPHTQQNITLYALAGNYVTNNISGKEANTSMMKISIINSSGSAITTSMHIETSVKNSAAGIGTINYVVETLTNGTFYLPILNNSNWAEVSIFPDNSPPMKKKLNLTAAENNVTLVTIDPTSNGDKGLRQMNASGSLVLIDSSGMPFDLRFLRTGTNEVITNMSADNFNPLKALVAGKVDLEIKMRATNITMKFYNFDMFSAKQPPMFAVMDNSTLTSSVSQTWQFGNFVPKEVYDNATLIIPYSNSTVNESWSYKMKVPVLYEEDQNNAHQFKVAWNLSRGDTSAQLSDDLIAYNDSGYRELLTSAGVDCSTNMNSGAVCLMDQASEEFIIKIPHFSGLTPSVSGTAPSPSGTTTPSSGTGGGVGGDVTNKTRFTSWIKITPGAATIWNLFDKDLGIKQINITVNNPAQSVTITITKYAGLPAEVTKAKSGKVYKYLKINTTNLERNLSKAIITIQVEKSWLKNNNLTKDKMALFKFDGVWKELKTDYKEEDSTNYYYDTELTSFSYFAIAEKETAPLTTPSTTPSAEPTTPTAPITTPTTPLIGKTTAAVIIGVIIAVIVIALVYYFYKKRKKY